MTVVRIEWAGRVIYEAPDNFTVSIDGAGTGPDQIAQAICILQAAAEQLKADQKNKRP